MKYPNLNYPILALSVLGALVSLPVLADTDATTAPVIPAVSVGYQFTALQSDDPLGPVYEVDFVDSDGHQTPVLEIAAGTKTLSQMDRAKIIANRLQVASLADKDFWKNIKSTLIHNQVVIASTTADTGLILTADHSSAVLTGMSQDQYAAFLLKQIKTALVGKLRDAKFDYQLTTKAEQLERANIYRQQGDQAFHQKDEVRAESMYRQSTKVSPSYAVAYLGLASLYMHQGKTAQAKDVLKEAQGNCKDLFSTADQLMLGQNSQLAMLITQVKNGV